MGTADSHLSSHQGELSIIESGTLKSLPIIVDLSTLFAFLSGFALCFLKLCYLVGV